MTDSEKPAEAATNATQNATETSAKAYSNAAKESTQAFSDATKTATNAFGSAADRIREMLGGVSLPGFNIDAYISARQADIDAVSKATSVAFAGAQTITNKQAELLKESLEELHEALTARKPGDSLGDVATKERELIQSSLSRTLEGMKEMAEAAQKSQAEIFDIALDRVRSNAEQLRSMFVRGDKA